MLPVMVSVVIHPSEDLSNTVMIYREITAQDLPEIFELRIATWHTPNGREELKRLGITTESVSQLMTNSHKGWLCYTDARIAGFAMGNKETGEMWVIAVLKAYENHGIGRTLLGKVEDWLFSEGWKELWLTTDPDETARAVGFYRNLGWKDWKMENGDRYMRKFSCI